MADHDPRAAEVLAEASGEDAPWCESCRRYVNLTNVEKGEQASLLLDALSAAGLTVVDAGHLDRLEELVRLHRHPRSYVASDDLIVVHEGHPAALSAVRPDLHCALSEVLDRKEQTDG